MRLLVSLYCAGERDVVVAVDDTLGVYRGGLGEELLELGDLSSCLCVLCV